MCGSFTFDAYIFIGGWGAAQYRGIVSIYSGMALNNASEAVFAGPIPANTEK